jgi:hypothetical protein
LVTDTVAPYPPFHVEVIANATLSAPAGGGDVNGEIDGEAGGDGDAGGEVETGGEVEAGGPTVRRNSDAPGSVRLASTPCPPM